MKVKFRCTRCDGPHGPLTRMRERFCEEYMVSQDIEVAGCKAGYKASPTLKRTLYELLHEPVVKCQLAYLKSLRSKRVAVEADQILGGLMRIASFDPIDIFNDDGTLKKLSQIPPEVRKAIAGMKWSDGKLVEFKLPDKVRSYELLGKHKRLFADVQVHEGEISIRERIARGRRRALKGKES